MVVGVCQISLSLPGVSSLKAKRSIVRKVLDRSGAVDVMVAGVAVASLASDGFMADVEDQSAQVFVIE